MAPGGRGLLGYTLQRVVWSALYFAYVFAPGFPQSDALVTLLVAYFSLGSGYSNTLAIERAGAEAGGATADGARKEEASQLLNVTFQCGMTIATVLSILVAHFIAA